MVRPLMNTAVFLVSVIEHPECNVEENQYVFNLTAKEDWVYQWVVIDPRQPETYRQAEKMLKTPKTLGICHPSLTDILT